MILKGLVHTLKRHNQPVILYIADSTSKDKNGEYITRFTEKKEVIWPSTPLSARQLALSEAGSYTTEDRNLFQLEPCDVDLKFNDEFKVKNAFYTVRDLKDMRNEAGFIRYIGRKKDPKIEAEVIQ